MENEIRPFYETCCGLQVRVTAAAFILPAGFWYEFCHPLP